MIEEREMKIKMQHIEPVELKLVPASAREYSTNNIIDKDMSYMVAWDETYFHLVRCSSDGKLIVQGPEKLVTGYRAWDFTWQAGQSSVETREYDKPAEYTVVNVFSGGVKIRFRVHPFPSFNDTIRLQEGYYVFDVPLTAFQVEPWFYSEDVESVDVQIVTWW